MDLERYPIATHKEHLSYEFISKGQSGVFKIFVRYQKFYPGVYNLAFGDGTESENRIDSYTRLNNNDRDKIIATVAFTVMSFLKSYPGSIILAKGSAAARTRLYQMEINKNSIKFAINLL